MREVEPESSSHTPVRPYLEHLRRRARTRPECAKLVKYLIECETEKPEYFKTRITIVDCTEDASKELPYPDHFCQDLDLLSSALEQAEDDVLSRILPFGLSLPDPLTPTLIETLGAGIGPGSSLVY